MVLASQIRENTKLTSLREDIVCYRLRIDDILQGKQAAVN